MGDRTERTGSQVVHVRENSDHEMDAMFKILSNNDRRSIPFRDRDLPASFFTPPSQQKPIMTAHSREGSADSTGYPSTNHIGVRPSAHIHNRTQSSPASLQRTQFSTLPPPQHARQHSCDLILEEQPLPPGWEMAKTREGQIYFLK